MIKTTWDGGRGEAADVAAGLKRLYLTVLPPICLGSPLCVFLLVTEGKRIGFSASFVYPNWIFQLVLISGEVTFLKTKAKLALCLGAASEEL